MSLLNRLFKIKSNANDYLLDRLSITGNSTETYKFHGGCHGCTMQLKKGLGYCTGCRYFECNWALPDLNDESARRNKEDNAIRDIARKMANKNEY